VGVLVRVGVLVGLAYAHIGAAHLPDGETGPEFVRRNLDALGIGEDLQTVQYGNRKFILPESSQPGAAPMLQPKGNGRLQNTRTTKAERLEAAARKRAERKAARAEQIARTGKPGKTRADKGVKRRPNKRSPVNAA
jgi:hypothetical protein